LKTTQRGVRGKGKESFICIALYYERLLSKALRYGTCYREITLFYLSPARLNTSGMSHTSVYAPQPQNVTALLAGAHFLSS